MKFFIQIIILISIAFVSCSSPAERKAKERKEFSKFFVKFSSDSTFQVKHVQFPFQAIIHGFSEPVFSPSITRDRWQYIDFRLMDSTSRREALAMKQEIVSDGDTMRVQLKGIDNGTFVEYCFKKRSNEWVLVQRNDFSF